MNGTEETETAMRFVINYMKSLTVGRALLWCYLIWYLVMAAAYFDPSPQLWLTSAGLSLGSRSTNPTKRSISCSATTSSANTRSLRT